LFDDATPESGSAKCSQIEQHTKHFTRSHCAREEAALIASLCCHVGVLPEMPAPELAKSLPTPKRKD
jgi:hypothetical protein